MPTIPATERRRWTRRPALHFLLLGLIAYALGRGLTVDRAVPAKVIVLEGSRIEALRREDTRRTGIAPDDARMEALIQAEVDDEILLREALDANRHRSDPVVRDRLVRNMRFLGSEGDDEDLFERALELGMHRTDIVVRRRLVQIMRLLLATDASIGEVEESELRDYLERNVERFMSDARVRLDHVFFDARVRGDDLQHDALAAAVRLRAADTDTTPDSLGDALLVAPANLDVTTRALESLLGPQVAQAAARLPLAQWSEPLRSSYGLHLIRVRERFPSQPAELEAVRNRIEFEILNARRRQALDDALERLRQGYEVRIE
jgi:hypothetical protein